MNAADFEAAGLYDPAAPNAAQRLELLEWMDSRGLTLEQMIYSNERGHLPFAASLALIRPGPYLTQRELADRLGTTLEVVEQFRIAFGLPPVAPDAEWCNEAEAELFGAVAGGIGLFGNRGM